MWAYFFDLKEKQIKRRYESFFAFSEVDMGVLPYIIDFAISCTYSVQSAVPLGLLRDYVEFLGNSEHCTK